MRYFIEICICHGGSHVDHCVLEYGAACFCLNLPTFKQSCCLCLQSIRESLWVSVKRYKLSGKLRVVTFQRTFNLNILLFFITQHFFICLKYFSAF